jgi:ABC-type glycerol-3-phosphate transport system permease component
MFSTSLKSKDEYISNKIGPPKELYYQNYIEIFKETRILLWLRNTVILAIVSVAVCILISILAAYSFSKIEFKFKHLIFNFYIALMVVSPIILVIPLFIFFTKLKLINNFIAPVLIYVGLMILWTIFMLKSFFDDIPQSIIESAVMDGASNFRIIFRIVVPLSAPAIFTLIMVDFLFVWNELLIALVFLQKVELQTLMAGLSFFKSRYNINIPMTMVGLVIATLPMALLYIFGQRYFVENLTMGYSKGGE